MRGEVTIKREDNAQGVGGSSGGTKRVGNMRWRVKTGVIREGVEGRRRGEKTKENKKGKIERKGDVSNRGDRFRLGSE